MSYYSFNVDRIVVTSSIVRINRIRKDTFGGVVAYGIHDGREIRAFTYFLSPDPDMIPDWDERSLTLLNFLPISLQSGLFSIATSSKKLIYNINTVNLSGSGFLMSEPSFLGALNAEVMLQDGECK